MTEEQKKQIMAIYNEANNYDSTATYTMRSFRFGKLKGIVQVLEVLGYDLVGDEDGFAVEMVKIKGDYE